MRVLAVTNMYPTPHAPTSGTFVEQQIKGLKQIGVEVDVMFVDRKRKGMGVYLGLGSEVRARMRSFQANLIHVMYGGIMADQVTRAVNDVPTVVSFCGSDLLGELLSGSIRRLISGYGVVASRRAAKRATGIVVKSKNLQDALPADVDGSKVRLIPNGVDLERFKPLDREKCREQLGWTIDAFHVLVPVGDPLKRPELARTAVEIVKRSGIQVEMHELRGVPHEMVPTWLNGCDVIVLSSLHEGSPNIIKEALACDLAVVSVDVGDVAERIKGIKGCYLGLPEPGDLAAKLGMVHAGTRRVAGRVKVQELSLQRIALRLEDFYSEVWESFWRKNGESTTKEVVR